MIQNVDKKLRHFSQIRAEMVADIMNSNLTAEQLEDVYMYINGMLSSGDPRCSAAVKKIIDKIDKRINWMSAQVNYYAAKVRLAEAVLGHPIEDWLTMTSSKTSGNK